MSCRGQGVRLGRTMPAALSGRHGGAKGGRKVNPTERKRRSVGLGLESSFGKSDSRVSFKGDDLGRRTALHAQKGPVLGLLLACCPLEILNFGTKSPHCHFAPGPAKYESVHR